MLIIANGAFKSGSTWQRDILQCILEFTKVPIKYASKKNQHLIAEKELPDFIKNEDIQAKNYITKAHIYNERMIKKITNKKYVYIFIITRSPEDAIVSHYYHIKNLKKLDYEFSKYYWKIGRYKLMQICKYEKTWKKYKDADNVYHSTFEGLKKDFEGEIEGYLEFLGMSVHQGVIDKIVENTDINKKRNESNRAWFFRKGITGESKDYIDAKIRIDIEKIKNAKISIMDRVIYLLIIEARQKLKKSLSSSILQASFLDRI